MRLVDTNGDNAKLELSVTEISQLVAALTTYTVSMTENATKLIEAGQMSVEQGQLVKEHAERSESMVGTFSGTVDAILGTSDREFLSMLQDGPFAGWTPDDGGNPIGISA